MNVKNSLRRLIPKQRELPGWIGGVRMLVSRIGVYLGYVNWVMLSVMLWTLSLSPFVRSIFLNSYWLFLFLGLGSVVAIALFVEWVLVLPSEIRFTQNQWAKGDRSPIYREVVETRKTLEKFEKKFEKEISELKRELRGRAN